MKQNFQQPPWIEQSEWPKAQARELDSLWNRGSPHLKGIKWGILPVYVILRDVHSNMYSLSLVWYTDSLRRYVLEERKWMCFSNSDAYPIHYEPVAERLQKQIICSIDQIKEDQKEKENLRTLARFEPRTSPYFEWICNGKKLGPRLVTGVGNLSTSVSPYENTC